MKRTLINIAILSTILGTGMAQAGGWDRSGQDTSIILKEGNLLEVTSVSVKPNITGTYNSTAAANNVTATGGVAEFCKIVVHITALFFLPFDRFQRSRRLGSAIHLQWRLSA